MRVPAPEVDLNTFLISDVPANPEPFRLLNRIPIRECGEPLVDLRDSNPDLAFGVGCLPYVRESVAQALFRATARTPEHLELRVSTGLRTLKEQADMYWHNYNRAKEQHPTWPESTLRRMTNRFFAAPDAKAPPGHCTGAAVDVMLYVRATGEPIDVSSPIEGWNAAPTAVQGLSPQAAENRRLLCYVMHATGLSNCRDEFWHWSFGDSAWAVRIGQSEACYGHIEPPENSTRVTGRKLILSEYDPNWPQAFAEIRNHLAHTLGSTPIEHVGSTSVPGLAAKPIIDIDIVAQNQSHLDTIIKSLETLGYRHEGDLGITGREALKADQLPAKDWPEHHLYACLVTNNELSRHLRFRDALRSNPSCASEYADLKRRLAARFPWDRIRYTDGKTAFIEDVLRTA